MNKFEEMGGKKARSVKDIGFFGDIVVTMLPNSDLVK